MKIQFNEAQLDRVQRESLVKIVDVLQTENENEIEVTAVEFPMKLLVKLDNDVEMLLGWDVEKDSYAGLTTPEPEPDPTPEPIPEPTPEPESTPEPTSPTIPAAELVKSEVGQRVEALANALIKLSKPFDFDQRLEIWIAFCSIVFKELLK